MVSFIPSDPFGPRAHELDREALKDCMLAGLRATKRLRVLSNAIPSAHKSTTGTKKKDKAKAKAKAKGKDKAKGKAKAKAKGEAGASDERRSCLGAGVRC